MLAAVTHATSSYTLRSLVARMWWEDTSPINPNCSNFSAKWKRRATLKMAVPVHASTRGVGLRMPHIAAHCTILSTSEAPAHSRARVSGFDDSSEEILGGGRAGARPETEHASRRTRHLFFCFFFFVFLLSTRVPLLPIGGRHIQASQEECVARAAD